MPSPVDPDRVSRRGDKAPPREVRPTPPPADRVPQPTTAASKKSVYGQRVVVRGHPGGSFTIGEGTAYGVDTPELSVRKDRLPAEEAAIGGEVSRLAALRATMVPEYGQSLKGLTGHTHTLMNASLNALGSVFDLAEQVVRGDPALIQEAAELEKTAGERLANIVTPKGHMCAEWAVEHASRLWKARMDKALAGANEYMRSSADDIINVTTRIATDAWKRLMGSTEMEQVLAFIGTVDHPTVFVGEDIGPELAAHIIADAPRQHVQGFATEKGGVLGHLLIVGRDSCIPVCVEVPHLPKLVETGTPMILDDFTGDVVTNPTQADREYFGQKGEWYQGIITLLKPYRKQRAHTGGDTPTRIHFGANVEMPVQTQMAALVGADGVRLYRMEYFYHRPDIQEAIKQSDYEYIFDRRVEDLKVSIRLYEDNHTIDSFRKSRFYMRVPDFRIDKPHHAVLPLIKGREDLLEQGGINLLLNAIDPKTREPELLITEIMAILAVSEKDMEEYHITDRHPMAVMLPMVNTAGDVRRTKEVMAVAQGRLDHMGTAHDPGTPLYTMFETMTSIDNADKIFAEGIYGGSIGSNDLIREITGTRDTGGFRHHPEAYKLIRRLGQAADEADAKLTLCGEMASIRAAIETCIGSGVTRFSVGPASMLFMKRFVELTDPKTCRWFASQVDRFDSPGAFEDFVKQHSDARRKMDAEFEGVMPGGFKPVKLALTDLSQFGIN